MRTFSERTADVRRVVEAGAAVVRTAREIAPEIARTSGLSLEGVKLGLEHHVESAPTDDDLRALVERGGETSTAYVVLSANVFVAPLRAVAMALAAADRVVVRPSRRAPVFANALVRALDDSRVTLVEQIGFEELRDGEVHAYGRDASIAAIRARTPAGVRVRGHGAGMGVAIVSASAPLEDAASALADDIVPFDQRGCLSPRVAFVEGAIDRARQFSAALSAALERLATTVPRGALDDDEISDAVRYGATVSFAGELWRGTDHLVGLAPTMLVPPAGRHLHVVPIDALSEVTQHLEPVARYVVAIGSDALVRLASVVPAHARASVLGSMQRPRLDGPVDLRADTG